MKLHHPFEWLPIALHKPVFIIISVISVAKLASLSVIGLPLINETAPYGIISFELAGGLLRAERMIDSWGQIGQVYAHINLGLDYLFIAAYTSSIGLGCVIIAHNRTQAGSMPFTFGILLAWAQLGAAFLDALENYALIQVLHRSAEVFWPITARWCAIPKFGIILFGFLYILLGFVRWSIEKTHKK